VASTVAAVALAASAVAARAADEDAAALVTMGRRRYMRSCAGCHGVSAGGDGPDAAFLTQRPADLRASAALRRYTDKELSDFVRQGRHLRLEVRPEALRLHAQQAAALETFLRRIPALDWDAVDAGRDVYLDRCVPCHDAFGQPQAGLPPGVQRAPRDLTDPAFQAAVNDAALRELVRHGKAAMPALVPRITPAQADDLAAFVRVLSPGYTLYVRHCEVCHGPRGQGVRGLAVEAGAPRLAFDEPYFAGRSLDAIRSAVWHMLEDNKPTMPHFTYVLSESDVGAIFAYLRSLPPPTAPAAASP
jgi:mono/diheme cytochrome c family protein